MNLLINHYDSHYNKLNNLYEDDNDSDYLQNNILNKEFENLSNNLQLDQTNQTNQTTYTNQKQLFNSFIEIKLSKLESCNKINALLKDYYINKNFVDTERTIELVDNLLEKQIFYNIKLKSIKDALSNKCINNNTESKKLSNNDDDGYTESI